MNLTAEQQAKAKEARRAYMAAYRKKPENKEKQRQYNERYWFKKASQIAQQ